MFLSNKHPIFLLVNRDGGGKGNARFIGYAGPFRAAGTATFPGHVFLMAPHGRPDEGYVCQVVKGTSTYFVDPFSEDEGQPGRCTKTNGTLRSKDELGDKDRAFYDQHKYNLEFGKQYKEFTGGSEWLTMNPKSPPRHKIWRADYFGQEHHVQTAETHFVEYPPEEKLPKLTMEQLRRNATTPVSLPEYRSPETTMNLTITAISVEPRVFAIENFLSDVEVEHMIDLAHQKKLKLSTTGSNNDESADTETRTSTNTWISRYSSPIVDSIFAGLQMR